MNRIFLSLVVIILLSTFELSAQVVKKVGGEYFGDTKGNVAKHISEYNFYADMSVGQTSIHIKSMYIDRIFYDKAGYYFEDDKLCHALLEKHFESDLREDEAMESFDEIVEVYSSLYGYNEYYSKKMNEINAYDGMKYACCGKSRFQGDVYPPILIAVGIGKKPNGNGKEWQVTVIFYPPDN